MDFARADRGIEAEQAGGRRVLIVRTGAMGDVLHGLAAVAALRRECAAGFIGWAIEPHWKALLAAEGERGRGPGMPLVDRVHEVPTRDWKRRPFSPRTVGEIAELRRDLRAERYDVCVDLQGSIRSAAIGRLSGAQRLVGSNAPREGMARLLYRERVAGGERHVIEQATALLAGALRQPLNEPAKLSLPVDAEAERWAEELLGRLERQSAADARRALILLHPDAGWGAKEWPRELYRELARSLCEAGYRVLVNGGGHGLSRGADAWGEDADVVTSSVGQLIALTRRMRLVVGGDSGPVHLAAALGVAVVALFGPTDPARNGPAFAGARVRVLRHPMSVTDHRRHPETEAGLRRISLDEVVSAARDLLGTASDEREHA